MSAVDEVYRKWAMRDTRTECKKKQQELFSLLGVMRREEVNLQNLRSNLNIAHLRSSADDASFDQTVLRLRLLAERVRGEMQRLPNKKRLAAQAKESLLTKE